MAKEEQDGVWLPWAAARRRILLFALETRALWDLVAGLRLLVGVLPSGVPLPLSFSLSALSLAPEGGIASNICSILENPGAQIEADLVFRRREFSDIFPTLSVYRSSTLTTPPTISGFSEKPRYLSPTEFTDRVVPKSLFSHFGKRVSLNFLSIPRIRFPGTRCTSLSLSLSLYLSLHFRPLKRSSKATLPSPKRALSLSLSLSLYFAKTIGRVSTRRVWLFLEQTLRLFFPLLKTGRTRGTTFSRAQIRRSIKKFRRDEAESLDCRAQASPSELVGWLAGPSGVSETRAPTTKLVNSEAVDLKAV